MVVEYAMNVMISIADPVDRIRVMFALDVLKATCWNQVIVLLVEIIVRNAVVMQTMPFNVKDALMASSSIMECARNVH